MTEPKDAPPHPVDVIVGARVRAVRMARGISQTALADQLGITFQQIQKYERGANRVSASKLVEIATSLQVPAVQFLEGLGDATQALDPSPLGTPGAQDLLLAYGRLPEGLRRAVLQLAQTLGEAPPAEPMTQRQHTR
jgi:transcriptional regulator with XRE-family HTH domain